MKVWEGERIPPGTVLGYQIQWQSSPPQPWKTVDELEFYRAMFNGDALCFGRFIVAQLGPILTNEGRGVTIQELSTANVGSGEKGNG